MSVPNISEEPAPVTPSGSYPSYPPDHVAVVKDISRENGDSDLIDEEEEQAAPGGVKTFLGKRGGPPRDPDAIATRRSVFDDPRLAPFYWPKNDYENIHRFDPSARWTHREEKALLRKIDWKIILVATIGFSVIDLERNTIAPSGFPSSLHLTPTDFSLGNTVFLISFLCAGLPSQMVAMRIGPNRSIPAQICLWSIVLLSQLRLAGRASFLASRVFLGFFQGGLIPNMILYMSYFYIKTEFPIRFAIVCVSMNFSSVVASFLAGIFSRYGSATQAGSELPLLIQGLVTFAIGIFCFLNMPSSPTQTKTRFRPKGWFTEREEVILVNRVLRDDPSKGDVHNREGLTLTRLWTAVCDYDLWPLYILGFLFGIPMTPPLTYLTLLLRNARFDMFSTNLLTIPYQVVGIINMVLITLVSEFLNERTVVAMVGNIWVLPFLVALYGLPPSPNPWLFFGLVTGLLSYPLAYPIHVGWCSRNSGTVATRAVSASLYNMCILASNIVASQIYVASHALPRYERANRTLIIICSVNVLLLYPGTKLYYIWRNRQREKIWNGMMAKEKVNYLETTKDVGNRRLDFRFAH